jgi:hypothetical protein
MIQSIGKRFSYGNVMATIAVFLVLGGGAAVAAGLQKNSVTTKAIKNGAVSTAKLKNNAVTGAKANEATFGIVPLAARADVATTADKALKADSATTATSATSAATATKAETAVKAEDAESLDGRDILEVRSTAIGFTEPDNTNLTEGGVSVLSGAALVLVESDLVANASVRVVNNGAAQAFVECELQNEGDGSFESMGQIAAQTIPAGHTIMVGLTGMANNVPSKGAGDPESLRVFCKESVGATLTVESADVTLTRVPIG